MPAAPKKPMAQTRSAQARTVARKTIAKPVAKPAKPAAKASPRAAARRGNGVQAGDTAPTAKAPTNRADSRLPQLMEESAALFAARGFDGTSVRDIVGRVGMLPGSLYAHFANKEELLLAVYEEGVRRIHGVVQAAIDAETDPWARLEAACRAHLDNLLQKSPYAQVVIRVRPEDVPGVRARLIALRDGYEQVFRALVSRLPLAAGSDRRALRLMLLGALNWSPEWYKPGGDSPRKIASSFIKLLRA